METAYYWLASWLEKSSDGTVAAYRTAVPCETLPRAVEIVGAMLAARAKEQPATQHLIYNIGMADDDAAELVGKIVPDVLGIDWPEEK